MTLNEPDFNWIEARAGCTTAAVFAPLVRAVRRDVERIDALDRRQGVIRRFVFNATDRDCTVERTPGGHQPAEAGVAVSLAQDGSLLIESVRPNHQRTAMFKAVARLQDDGRCRLVVDGAPVHVWQVSKRALEGLFFDGGAKS